MHALVLLALDDRVIFVQACAVSFYDYACCQIHGYHVCFQGANAQPQLQGGLLSAADTSMGATLM